MEIKEGVYVDLSNEEDNRSFIKKLWCKLFHTDEKFIDIGGDVDFHAVAYGHRCFNGCILTTSIWYENQWKEKGRDFNGKKKT